MIEKISEEEARIMAEEFHRQYPKLIRPYPGWFSFYGTTYERIVQLAKLLNNDYVKIYYQIQQDYNNRLDLTFKD